MSARVFVIAEAGVNHNGSLATAKRLVEVAAEAGADAVKFQTFKASEVVSSIAPKADYQVRTTGREESQLEMVRRLELDEAAHLALVEQCATCGIEFMSSPFDHSSVALLARLGVKRLKLGSSEITNAPLLLVAARTGLPIILSTGMSTMPEIEAALGVLAFGYTAGDAPSQGAFVKSFASSAGRRALAEKVILLHCTTEYPAPFEDVNLCAMESIRESFSLPVGFSDHTPGIAVSIAAVALGAEVVEKHFTLDRNQPGPDHRASLEPAELMQMVKAIRDVGSAMGVADKRATACEVKNRDVARKSLVAARDIAAGELFSVQNLAIKRPGTGLPPIRFWELLGVPAPRSFRADELIEA